MLERIKDQLETKFLKNYEEIIVDPQNKLKNTLKLPPTIPTNIASKLSHQEQSTSYQTQPVNRPQVIGGDNNKVIQLNKNSLLRSINQLTQPLQCFQQPQQTTQMVTVNIGGRLL